MIIEADIGQADGKGYEIFFPVEYKHFNSRYDFRIKDSKTLVIKRQRNISQLVCSLSKKYGLFTNRLKDLADFRFRYVFCDFPISAVFNIEHKIYDANILISRIEEVEQTTKTIFLFFDNEFRAAERLGDMLLDFSLDRALGIENNPTANPIKQKKTPINEILFK